MLIRLFFYMGKYKKYAVLAMICITAEGILELLVPLIMADLVDVGVANGDTAYIYTKGAQMAACAVIALGLGIGSARFAALAGQGLGAELRRAGYEKRKQYYISKIYKFTTSSQVNPPTRAVTNKESRTPSTIPWRWSFSSRFQCWERRCLSSP